MTVQRDKPGITENIFAMVPLEVLADKRLTFEQMRVLIAVLSFRAKNTDVVWPSRDSLAKRCGVHPSNISSATSALAKLGWLTKDGNGGRSQSSCYRITVPDLEKLSTLSTTVADSATSKTVADSAIQTPETVAESATQTVADSARGKEQTSEQTIKSNRQGARGLLAQFGVTGELADAWMRVRQTKRLAITLPALEAIQREAAKASLSMEQAIRVCCEEGWGGFKANWPRNGGANDSQAAGRGGGQKPSAGGAWWTSQSGVMNRGKELGVTPRVGEDMASFRDRIFQAENNAKTLVTS